MRISGDDYRKARVKEIQEKFSMHSENRLYVWGCAKTAEMITDFIKKNSTLDIAAYIVDDLYYKETHFLGKPVYRSSDWLKMAVPGDYVIMGFVGGERAEQMIQTLPEGIKGVYFSFPYSANVDGTYLDYDTYLKNRKQYEDAYEMLADDYSKRTMEAFINACATGDVRMLDSLLVDNQYFNELTKGWATECFVDCGAYIGDTIEGAVDFYRDNLKKIVAFEPDEQNIAALRGKMEQCGMEPDKILVIEKGSWSEETILHFSSSDSSSSICSDGDLEIRVDSIDHVLSNERQSVSYIKLDVEGSERESLLGAKEIIKRDRPLIAVCAYHKAEDLYVLPKLINQLAGESRYAYYLRYHGPDLRELVLYAIPER